MNPIEERSLDAELILQMQHSAWSRDDRRPVEDWIREYPRLSEAPDAILDLIYQEFLLRTAAGETLDVASYAARFPDLAEEIRRLFDVHRALMEERDPRTTNAGHPPTSQQGTGSLPREFPRGLPRIAGYRIEGLLGRGGMGVVYRARQLAAHRDVALKVLLHGATSTPAEIQRFRNEARSASRLDHPGIVSIYDVGTTNDLPYYSMTLVEGSTLKEELEAGPCEPRRAARLLIEIAEAVQYGHDHGVIHRDLKPSNVLLSSDGRARIADFGLAKLLSDGSAGETLSGQVLGTPSYMAPEQARGAKGEVGPAVDIYALGALLYSLLTGRPPFLSANLAETLRQVCDEDPAPPRQWNRSIPADLETIALKCLEKSPAKRYASAAAVAEDLRRYLDGRPIVARPLRFHHRCWRWSLRNPMTAALIAGVAALSIGALAEVLWHGRSLARLNSTITSQNAELRQTADRLSDALQESKKLAAQATASERRTQALLHAAELQLAARAWQKGDLRESGRILAENARRLAPGAYPDFAWRYLDRQNRGVTEEQAGNVLHGKLIDQDRQPLYYATFSPDGKWLATCGGKGWIRVYDVQKNYELARQINTDQVEVNSVGFNSDASLIASAGDNGRVCLWLWPKGDLVRSVTAYPESKVFGVAFVNDATRFATGGPTEQVILWDVNQDAPLHSWKVEPLDQDQDKETIEAVAVRPRDPNDPRQTEDVIALAGSHGRIAVARLDGNTFPPLSYERPDNVSTKCTSVAHSANGQYRAAGYHNGLVDVNNGTKGNHRHFSRPDGVDAVAVRNDGTVICTDRGGGITVDIPSAKGNSPGARRTWSGGAPRTPGLAIAPDGKHFITAGSNGEVRRWEIDAPEQNSQFTEIPLDVVNAWGPLVFLDNPLRVLRIVNVGANLVAQTFSPGADFETWTGKAQIHSCAFRDGVLVVGTADGTLLKLSSLKDAEPTELSVFPAHGLFNVHLFPTADRAFLTKAGSNFAIVDMTDGRVLVQSQLEPLSFLSFSPEGSHIACYERESHALVLLDGSTLAERRRYLGHARQIEQAAFSPDGTLVVSVGEDRTGIVWNITTGERLTTLSGHLAAILDVAYSPDGRVLATMDEARTIKLWSAETGAELYELARAGGPRSRIAFTPNGSHLVVGERDGSLIVFDGSPIETSE